MGTDDIHHQPYHRDNLYNFLTTHSDLRSAFMNLADGTKKEQSRRSRGLWISRHRVREFSLAAREGDYRAPVRLTSFDAATAGGGAARGLVHHALDARHRLLAAVVKTAYDGTRQYHRNDGSKSFGEGHAEAKGLRALY